MRGQSRGGFPLKYLDLPPYEESVASVSPINSTTSLSSYGESRRVEVGGASEHGLVLGKARAYEDEVICAYEDEVVQI
jgi:hypothetical protein